MDDSLDDQSVNDKSEGISDTGFKSEYDFGARTVQAKASERNQLAADIEAFLSRGGKVESVNPNVMADPPQKPDSSYGSRPI